MKKTIAVKALNRMIETDEQRVHNFIERDLRDIDEIICSICDETEYEYVMFMYELFKIAKKFESEEIQKKDGNSLIKLKDTDVLKLSEDQRKKISDLIKNSNYMSNINLQIPKMDLSNFIRRNY